MVKFNKERMLADLNKFGDSYNYPIYCSVVDIDNFFSNGRPKLGFAAITDNDELIMVEYPAMGILENEIIHRLPLEYMIKCNIKNNLFGLGWILKTVFRINGKKVKYNINVTKKIGGNSDFDEQPENSDGFVHTFRCWQARL